VGFDRPLLLISSFNKLMPGPNFRGRSKLPIGSVEFRLDPIVGLNLLGRRASTDTDQWKKEIRISRAINQCKHEKILLENIKSVIKMRVQVQKMLDPTGSIESIEECGCR